MTTFGQKTRMLRLLKNWSQQQLADAAQVSRQMIINIENEKSIDPPIFLLVAIANALGVTPNDLLEGYFAVPADSVDRTDQLLSLARSANADMLHMLADVVDRIQNLSSKE